MRKGHAMRFSEHNDWASRVTDDFDLRGVEIKLALRRDRVTDYVTRISPDTTLLSVPDGETGPPGLKLPDDAAHALWLALSDYFGPPPDDYRARYEEALAALTVERARVDLILGSQDNGPTSPPSSRA